MALTIDSLENKNSFLVRNFIDESICVVAEHNGQWHYVDLDSLWSKPFDSKELAVAAYETSINETVEEKQRRKLRERQTYLDGLSREGECFLALIHAAENYKISFQKLSC